MLVRGKSIDITPYYSCPYCGALDGCLIQCSRIGSPSLGGLLMPEGPLTRMEWADGPRLPWASMHVEIVIEVGRSRCSAHAWPSHWNVPNGVVPLIDHVFYDWRWKVTA